MYDNDHLDEQWLRQTPPPRRRGAGCGLTLLLVLLLVLAGAVFYPRIRARLTPVQMVQIQRESSVLPDTAPNCSANPRVAAVLHTAMREQRTRSSTAATPTRSPPVWASCSTIRSSGCARTATRCTAG